IKQLTDNDYALERDQPGGGLRPEITKNGQAANLPMLPECRDALLPLGTKQQVGKVFAEIPHITTLYGDLANAGVPRVDGEGRRLDFHSFRYFFCKLMAERLPIQKVKVLMRHSRLKLTADLYGELGIDDLAEGVWTLPPLFPQLPELHAEEE